MSKLYNHYYFDVCRNPFEEDAYYEFMMEQKMREYEEEMWEQDTDDTIFTLEDGSILD